VDGFRELSGLLNAFDSGARHLMVQGLRGSSKALVAAFVHRNRKEPLLFLTVEIEEAQFLGRALQALMPQGSILYLPPSPGEGAPLRHRLERVLCLFQLLQTPSTVLISPLASLLSPLPSPDDLRFSFLTLYPHRLIEPSGLVEALLARGYREERQVNDWGEFSRRGGMLDFFPPGNHPVRVEFFGNEIVSLRRFDPGTQRSVGPLSQITVPPLVHDSTDHQGGAGLLDYFATPPLLLLDEPDSLARAWKEKEAEGAPVPSWERILQAPRISLTAFLSPQAPAGVELLFSLSTSSLPPFGGRLSCFAEAAREWAREGYRVRLFCKSPGQARRLEEALREHDLGFAPEEDFFSPAPLSLMVGDLPSGFCLPALKLAVVSEEEIFGGRLREPAPPRPAIRQAPLPLEDLKYGDFLVHVDHGIGLYKGLRKIRVGGVEGEYLLIQYAGTDRLYVPLDKLNLVHRYVGADAAPPAVDRLGSPAWIRSKERAKAATRKIAQELLDLYASRKLAPGHAFSPDSPWQAEFEAAFPYEETPDQLQAIQEVKRDMESPHPMDRLVCGDVGFGKTEVAMRAAFKACLEGKQVAVLVPTTVLALQHHQTFSERFSPFPVRVEMLSRFLSPKEQAEVVRALARGEVDVVIGTHRLLQKDICFRDLGLLIIDEEHRFGVADKERIKQLKKEVDCLTLTATPIPRTLYMSLVGLRDISLINTPPEERMSVQTFVVRFDAQLIKEAIEKEMERGGQVFFVYNRVQSIDRMASYLRRLVPAARIAVAHGQMPEEELEKVMVDFYARRYDLLLSTTIVESGLDLPRANTIIIHRADRLGLAQLYQLRGRVGRDRHQAYAYLLVPEASLLSRESRQRLQAISELSELGAGYKLALRDLQIRGAGNLLGPEQHGHVAAVGFELYCRLLEETIRELRGEEVEAPLEPTLRLRIEAFFPESYVPDADQRFLLYKRLLALEGEEELEDFRQEMEDRFGPLPRPARSLLEMAEIRLLARHLRIKEIEARKRYIRLTFAEKPRLDPDRVTQLLLEGKVRYRPENILEMEVDHEGPERQVELLKNLLQQLG